VSRLLRFALWLLAADIPLLIVLGVFRGNWGPRGPSSPLLICPWLEYCYWPSCGDSYVDVRRASDCVFLPWKVYL